MQCLVIYVLFIQFCFISCSQIKVTTVKNDITIIQGTKLQGGDNVPINATEIIVEEYDNEQVTSVSDLPELENIWMHSLNQSKGVVFTNVPKLVFVDLSKNHLGYISRDMFGTTGLENVFLYHNRISIIEQGSFGPKVTIVSLYFNQLTKVRADWFQDPSKLTTLELFGNKIAYLVPDLFKDFVSLTTINLAFNQLQTISEGVFSGGNHFEELILSYNNLIEIKPKAFQKNITINHIDFGYNNLTYLPETLMMSMKVTSSFVMDNNPWSCNCYYAILKWLEYEEVHANTDIPKCIVSEDPKCQELTDRTTKVEHFMNITNMLAYRKDVTKFYDCTLSEFWSDCYSTEIFNDCISSCP